jgi:hypothetical protein
MNERMSLLNKREPMLKIRRSQKKILRWFLKKNDT